MHTHTHARVCTRTHTVTRTLWHTHKLHAHAKQNGFELLRELLELGHEAVGNGLPYARPLR